MQMHMHNDLMDAILNKLSSFNTGPAFIGIRIGRDDASDCNVEGFKGYLQKKDISYRGPFKFGTCKTADTFILSNGEQHMRARLKEWIDQEAINAKNEGREARLVPDYNDIFGNVPITRFRKMYILSTGYGYASEQYDDE